MHVRLCVCSGRSNREAFDPRVRLGRADIGESYQNYNRVQHRARSKWILNGTSKNRREEA
jgi:hypothetical protein